MAEPKCPNLKQLFGKTYKITFDPAYDPKGISKLDPWMMQIQGRKGTIYPYGEQHLAAEIDSHPHALKLVLDLPSSLHWQDGQTEHTVVFPLSSFEGVARILQLRKKRQASPEQREKMGKIGKERQEKLRLQRLESKSEEQERRSGPNRV